MKTAELLDVILVGLTHLAELQALYQRAAAEGRDLTPEEVEQVRAKAVGAIDSLGRQIETAATDSHPG
jgi:hypothetical protein